MCLKTDIATAFDEALSKIDVSKPKETKQKTDERVKYRATTHAINRAVLRFGIEAEHVSKWINKLMDGAKLINRRQRGLLEYLSDGVRLVVDGKDNVVVTLYSEVSTSFLRPVLDRELRKMERGHTRLIRQIELDKAMSLRKYADMAINYAKARNPKTRELISERMAEVQAIIDGYDMRMDRMEDEYKQRVRAIELIAD